MASAGRLLLLEQELDTISVELLTFLVDLFHILGMFLFDGLNLLKQLLAGSESLDVEHIFKLILSEFPELLIFDHVLLEFLDGLLTSHFIENIMDALGGEPDSLLLLILGLLLFILELRDKSKIISDVYHIMGSLDFLFDLFFDTLGSEDLVENIFELKGRNGVTLDTLGDLINNLLVLDIGLDDGTGSVHVEQAEVLFGLFVTVDHVDNSFLEHVVFDTEVSLDLALISEESQVTDLRDSLFSKSERVVGEIESFEPFHDWKLVHSLVIFKKQFPVQDGLFRAFSELQEVALKFCH